MVNRRERERTEAWGTLFIPTKNQSWQKEENQHNSVPPTFKYEDVSFVYYQKHICFNTVLENVLAKRNYGRLHIVNNFVIIY